MAREHPIELFMPPNMLKAKVGGARPGIDPAVMRRAETAMETLKAECQDWGSAEVAKLNAARDAFVKDANAGSRDRLYRMSLDIVGQAQTFDFPLAGRVAKSLCDLIAFMTTPSDIPLTLIDAHVNAVRIIFRDDIRTDADPKCLELARELEARVAELAPNAD